MVLKSDKKDGDIMLFDSHAHYDDERFNEDRFEVIENAHKSGVAYILNAACHIASAKECIYLADKYEFIYAAVGIHPHEVEDLTEESMNTLFEIATNRKVVAIGEIGLDYYYDTAPRETQRYWFKRQIQVARELKLPVIVHDRDAHKDCMDIVKSEGAKEVGGVFHCYSGSVEMARELLENNFYVSVGGSLTFKNAKKLLEVVKELPLERLLIETDCPYLTPEPHRGKRNDSSYVKFVAQKVAEIKNMSIEEVENITMENAKRLFGIGR